MIARTESRPMPLRGSMTRPGRTPGRYTMPIRTPRSIVDVSCDASPRRWGGGGAGAGATPGRYTMPIRTPRSIVDVSCDASLHVGTTASAHARSEEHTSELQSRLHLVCRLL